MPKPLGSVTLPRLPPLQTEKDSLGYPLSVPEMQFSPKQGVVARLEKEGMELVLYPIELSQGWNDANFAAAIPKIGFCAARLSQPIDYQVSVPAGCQLKQCRLIIGPKGMSVTQQGRLEWTAPPKADSQAISALIEVATADDSIATHLVVITVGPASAIDSRGNPMMRPGVTPLHAYQPMSIGDLQGIGPDIDRTGIVRLPSKVKGVALAGGGNYLIIEMPELEMLGVFDVLAGQIVAYLANFPDVFTASSDSIILVERPSPAGDRRLRSIERWLVPDLKRADKAQPDESVAPWGLAMGNNDNQLLLVKSSRLGRENLHRFDAADLSRTNSIPMSGNVDQRVDEFRVSGDGNLIVWRMRGVAKIFIYGQAADESWRSLEYESESKLAMPTTDGRRIVLDHEVLQLSDDAKSVKATPLGSRMLATAEGSLGLGVPAHLSLSGRPANRLDVVNLKTGKAVGAIDGLFEFDDPESQSVWLLPEQGWLLQLDPSRTMLLRKSVKLSSR